jgi:acyl-CoA thioester hydrolase
MGVVYYANYLVWMEVGRTDYCKSVGFSYRDMEADDANMAVAEATCRYVFPAKYDDEILVETRIERLTRRIVKFAYTITHGQTRQLLAHGSTTHIAVGKDGKTRSIPPRYFELMHTAFSS